MFTYPGGDGTGGICLICVPLLMSQHGMAVLRSTEINPHMDAKLSDACSAKTSPNMLFRRVCCEGDEPTIKEGASENYIIHYLLIHILTKMFILLVCQTNAY